MPALASCLLDAVWSAFSALLPAHPAVAPTPPLGCHRRPIPERGVFEQVVAALVHGSGDERIARPGCWDRPIRRRLTAWAHAGLTETLHPSVLRPDDRLIGVACSDRSVEGCSTQAPGGGPKAGRSPVDRGEQGLKRSTVTDARGVPVHVVAAGANRPDAPVLQPTLGGLDERAPRPTGGTAPVDRASAGAPTRALLDARGVRAEIARTGIAAPVQAGMRWGAERTTSWMNADGTLRRCTERDGRVVDVDRFPAAALVTARILLRRARSLDRWPSRPTTRRLK